MRKKLKVDHAYSMNNGILFYSKRHKNYVAIASINEEGAITTEWTTIKEYKMHKSKDEKRTEMKKKIIFVLCILPFLTMFTILLEWMAIKNPIYGTRTFLIGYSLILLATFMITNSIEKKQERNYYKFHSAEHMVLNAYRKLKRIPSLEEIHQYSRFSNSCGTNTITQLVISFILIFAATFISNPFYRLIGILSVNVIVLILVQCGFLNFLQKFTTITPTDKELLVAISGMNVWLENEKKEKEKSRIFRFFHRLFPRVFH